jgi:hypothetical protein
MKKKEKKNKKKKISGEVEQTGLVCWAKQEEKPRFLIIKLYVHTETACRGMTTKTLMRKPRIKDNLFD